MSRPDQPTEAALATRTGLGRRCLHLAALAALVVAQPLLDLLARHPTFLVVHRMEGAALAGLLAALLLLPPLPPILLELMLGRAPQAVQQAVHLAWLVLGGALLVLLLLPAAPWLDGAAAVAAGLAGGLALAGAYRRFAPLRMAFDALAIGLLLVPLLFLLQPRVRALVGGDRPAGALARLDSDVPVVLVILDELSLVDLLDGDGRINRHRYPHLAAFAAEATFFRNALAAAENTQRAVPAILTGRLPPTDAMPNLVDHPQNIFTLFGADYRIVAGEPVTFLCPPALNRLERASEPDRWRRVAADLRVVYLHLIAPPSWAEALPPIDATWGDFAGGEPAAASAAEPTTRAEFFRHARTATHGDRLAALDDFLAAIAPHRQPGLYVFHALLPHPPWVLTPDGRPYGGRRIRGLRGEAWLDNLQAIHQGYQRYVWQIQLVDAFVGRLMRRLEEVGLYGRALIVLVADHGVAFQPGRHRRRVAPETLAEILSVPLLIKAPGQRRGEIADHPVSTVDVLPTVLDLLAIPPPWPLDGRSAFKPREDPTAPFTFLTLSSGEMTVDPAAVAARRRQLVSERLALFGDGSDPYDLYRIGPLPELIGRRVEELRIGAPSYWRLALPEGASRPRVDGDGPLPLLLEGHLRQPPRPEPADALAIAVNGVVAATLSVPQIGGRWRLVTILLPPDLWHPGTNVITAYEVRLRRRAVLRPVTIFG